MTHNGHRTPIIRRRGNTKSGGRAILVLCPARDSHLAMPLRLPASHGQWVSRSITRRRSFCRRWVLGCPRRPGILALRPSWTKYMLFTSQLSACQERSTNTCTTPDAELWPWPWTPYSMELLPSHHIVHHVIFPPVKVKLEIHWTNSIINDRLSSTSCTVYYKKSCIKQIKNFS